MTLHVSPDSETNLSPLETALSTLTPTRTLIAQLLLLRGASSQEARQAVFKVGNEAAVAFLDEWDENGEQSELGRDLLEMSAHEVSEWLVSPQEDEGEGEEMDVEEDIVEEEERSKEAASVKVEEDAASCAVLPPIFSSLPTSSTRLQIASLPLSATHSDVISLVQSIDALRESPFEIAFLRPTNTGLQTSVVDFCLPAAASLARLVLNGVAFGNPKSILEVSLVEELKQEYGSSPSRSRSRSPSAVVQADEERAKLHVSNLPVHCRPHELIGLFNEAGVAVLSVKKMSKGSRFTVVEVSSEDAAIAEHAVDAKMLRGCSLHVRRWDDAKFGNVDEMDALSWRSGSVKENNQTTPGKLKALVSSIVGDGSVTEMHVGSGRSGWFAHLSVPSERLASIVIEELDDRLVDGHCLRVERATPPRDEIALRSAQKRKGSGRYFSSRGSEEEAGRVREESEEEVDEHARRKRRRLEISRREEEEEGRRREKRVLKTVERADEAVLEEGELGRRRFHGRGGVRGDKTTIKGAFDEMEEGGRRFADSSEEGSSKGSSPTSDDLIITRLPQERRSTPLENFSSLDDQSVPEQRWGSTSTPVDSPSSRTELSPTVCDTSVADQVDYSRLSSLNLTTKDIDHIINDLSRPIAEPPTQDFTRTIDVSFEFGYVPPDVARAALSSASPFVDDPEMQLRYEEFLLAQAGESRMHYLGPLRQVVGFNRMGEEFGRSAREVVGRN
ncbi:hypothetical protein MNV49_001448 [Pseudohyphozyma bogoriensis]|nr:hypothetical protein MNV49_001448 [Pseudohyphozyma bogoriensis]